jgi:hypothetical protein
LLQRLDCDANGEVTIGEFLLIDSLASTTALAVATAFGHGYGGVNYGCMDGAGAADGISPDELLCFVHDYADYSSFTYGHAELAVTMADRDGNGRLSLAEMGTILDGTYKVAKMLPEHEIADGDGRRRRQDH